MNGNPFFVQPGGDLTQGLAGLGQTFQQIGAVRREEEVAKRSAEKFARIKTEAMAAYQSGDPNQIAQFNINNPEMAEAMNLTEMASHRDEETLNNSLDSSYSFLANPTRDNAVKLVSQRKKLLISKGVPPEQQTETDTFLQRFDEDPDLLIKETEGRLAAVDTDRFVKYRKSIGDPVAGGGGPTTDLSRYANLIEDQYSIDNPGKTIPPKLKADAMMKLKRASPDEVSKVTMSKLLAELQLKPLITGAEATARGVETRASTLIDRGLLAAESTAVIRRGLELLDSVKTGGFDNVKLLAKRFFGVEGANEGELSNALGKSVLSQLRETFGAQFTQEEGNRLIRLEAGFSKSVANNRRILGQALRMAERTSKRARKSAKDRGDMATVADIDELLSFSLSVDGAVEPKQTSELSDDELFKAAGMP